MYDSQFEENKDKSISQKLDDLSEKMDKSQKKKKKFKLPAKAKISKLKARKGFATIQIVNENGGIEFKKEPIIDSVVRLQEGHNITFHAVDSSDILHYKGKPFLILPKTKKNPYNPNTDKKSSPNEGDNETYGHKYILARMESDVIKLKKKLGGWGMGIVGVVIAIIIGYSVLTGG